MYRHVMRILAGSLLLVTGLSAAEPLRLAPLPLENREAVVRQFQPLVNHLSEQLGEPVELVWPGYHADVLSAFINGEIDIAFLGPLPYLRLREQHAAATPMVRFIGGDGQEMYRCALVGFVDAPIPANQFAGKRIGLTQPLSTCGYFGTNAILNDYAGISLEQTDYRYLGSHEKVALSVIAGEVDAGGVKDEFAEKFLPVGLDILAWSEPVPGVALIANGATLSPARIEQLREILLATPEHTYQKWGSTISHGMKAATNSDFDALRAFGDIHAIPPRKGD